MFQACDHDLNGIEEYESIRPQYSPNSLLKKRKCFIGLSVLSTLALVFFLSGSSTPAENIAPLIEPLAVPSDENISINTTQFPSNEDPFFGDLPSVNGTFTHTGAYPGYPECESRVEWMIMNWNSTASTEEYYQLRGVNGSACSILDFLNSHGFYCPACADYNAKKIRSVNLGGWFVLEPWITPSLFEQFEPNHVPDEYSFCQTLGKAECKRQLEEHWATWVSKDDIRILSEAGINHVRIPVGYWIFGDIRPGEPWVNGALAHLQKAMYWFKEYNVSVIFDLHCAPGSQNGFDNSGRAGPIHWSDSSVNGDGTLMYPNIDRTLTVLDALVSMFALPPFSGVVKYIELINEAFVSIPIDIVKDFYRRGYTAVRNIDPDIGVIIGDSFRFGAWDDFMFPPEYRHVYIDTHIYQVFDTFRLSWSHQEHIDSTCETNLPIVAVAPLSTMVGEWSLATTDCAKWLNGYRTGSRWDGTFYPYTPLGSCKGQNDTSDTTVWTPEYKAFLREFAEKQMDAYESGSAIGWSFWNFKTEQAPQWNFLLGLKEGWIPSDVSKRTHFCPRE